MGAGRRRSGRGLLHSGPHHRPAVGTARLGHLVDMGCAPDHHTGPWLIYVSYLLLRRFAAGPQMQTLAAVLGIFGALDVPIVYMSNRWWRTQHPAPVFGGDPGPA